MVLEALKVVALALARGDNELARGHRAREDVGDVAVGALDVGQLGRWEIRCLRRCFDGVELRLSGFDPP
jgi:hypothetical protein